MKIINDKRVITKKFVEKKRVEIYLGCMKSPLTITKHRGLQVFVVLALYFILGEYLPPKLHSFFYTISLCIKDLLVWIMPLCIGFFIAHVVASFRKKAPLFLIAMIVFETLSNLSSVWYSFGVAHLVADHCPLIEMPSSSQEFSALWRFPYAKPFWWSADKGTFLGVIIGIVSAFTQNQRWQKVIDFGKKKAEWILTRFFSRLIPVFVLGFVAQMRQTGIARLLFEQYAILLSWLLLFLCLYIMVLFFLGSGSRALHSLGHLLPAGGIAFSSGCSLSTMPWTIDGAAKNLQNPSFAKAVIPATTNIQQIGDCIVNTFLCFLLYKNFYGHSPDIATWLSFSSIFVLARFATAAMLGGAIFVMLPIYESYLAFTPEMIAIILAFNVVLDPIVTSSNVLANGALCRLFEKMWLAFNGLLYGHRKLHP